MTDYRIIYPDDSTGVAVVVPAPGIQEEQALKAVPSDKPYLIVSTDTIPSNIVFRNAWEADFTNAPVKE